MKIKTKVKREVEELVEMDVDLPCYRRDMYSVWKIVSPTECFGITIFSDSFRLDKWSSESIITRTILDEKEATQIDWENHLIRLKTVSEVFYDAEIKKLLSSNMII